MVLLTRGRSQDRPQSGRKTREITSGCTVVVLNGRQFAAFGAGDEGVVLRVDPEAQNCDVLFSGKSSSIPVALRHLRPKSPTSREEVAGDPEATVGEAQAVQDRRGALRNFTFDERGQDSSAAPAVADSCTYTQEEVSLVCAADVSGGSDGWPVVVGTEPPTPSVAGADVVAREELEVSINGTVTDQGNAQASPSAPSSYNLCFAHDTHEAPASASTCNGSGTVLPVTDLQQTGLPGRHYAGFAAGVAALNAATAAAAAAQAAQVGNGPVLQNGAGTSVGSADAEMAKLCVGTLVRLRGLQQNPEMNGRSGMCAASEYDGWWKVQLDGGEVVCVPLANLERIATARPLEVQPGFVVPGSTGVAGELVTGHALSPVMAAPSASNMGHIDPSMRLCDTSSISAHSDVPASMGLQVPSIAGYPLAPPMPGWGYEAVGAWTAPAGLGDAASVGGCVASSFSTEAAQPAALPREVVCLRRALQDCIHAISTCSGIIESLRSEAASADNSRQAGVQASPPKSEDLKQAELQMVVAALQKAAENGSQALLATAARSGGSISVPAATAGSVSLNARSTSAPRTLSRASSCSGLRRGRSVATPVNVEVVGQQDLSMSLPEMPADPRRFLVASPNGKSVMDVRGMSVTPTRCRTPGAAPPPMQPSPPPQGVMSGSWGSAVAPVQRPAPPGPMPGMMQPMQPLSPPQWRPPEPAMMNVPNNVLGPPMLTGIPGYSGVSNGPALGVPPGMVSPSMGPGMPSFAGPGGSPPPANGAFPWPAQQVGQSQMVRGHHAGMSVSGPVG